ncbi:MAG: DNA primase [Flammeovirgaceae bacterium]
MRLSDQTIQEIRNTADILEVVEDYLPLKKKGQNWWALSPFTNEKTPSFSVSPAKGIFKCFSTGKGGDSITFVMEMEGVGYIEALKHLAKKYNIELEEEELSPEKQEAYQLRESLFIALNFAKEYYEKQLHETTHGKSIGLSYFKERGFSAETIANFELGYSQDEWNNFEEAALKKGHQPAILEQAGLVVAREDGKRYDRFRGRVMFPIHNLSGRVIGFGARTLKKDKQAKYLNSPESDVYHKSDVLYGLFQSKKAIRNLDNCYLVEGYTDVISLHQNGVENVVASSGTSLTENQIKLIKRFTPNVTVLFDGDKAGIRASLRGVDMLLAQGLNVRVVSFPEGQDPDSYVREIGGEAFQQFLKKNAQDFILFKTNLQLGETQGDPLKKAAVIRDIVESIAKIPDPIKRTVFCEECSHLLNVDVKILVEEVNKSILGAASKKQQQQRYKKQQQTQSSAASPKLKTPPKGDDQEPFFFEEDATPLEEEGSFQFDEADFIPIEGERTAEPEVSGFPDLPAVQEATEAPIMLPTKDEAVIFQEQESVRLLVEHGHKIENDRRLADYWFEEIEDLEFHSPLYREIIMLYHGEVQKGNYPDLGFFIHQTNEEIKETVINLTAQKGEVSANWFAKHEIYVPKRDEDIVKIFYRNVLKLKEHRLKGLLKKVLQDIKDAKTDNEISYLQNLYMELKIQENELAKLLGIYYS